MCYKVCNEFVQVHLGFQEGDTAIQTLTVFGARVVS